MKSFWQAIVMIGIFSVSGCGIRPATSSSKEVTALDSFMVCKALWVCKGTTTPVGQVTSRSEYPAEAYDLCKADLEEQIKNLYWCPNGEELLAESVAATTNEVVRKVLSSGSENGTRLLELMGSITSSLEQGCDGDACYTYWQSLVDKMASLANWQPYLVEKNLTVSRDIAKAAYFLNKRLCVTKHRGAKKWMDLIGERSQKAAEAARFVQLRFGVRSPSYCPAEK